MNGAEKLDLVMADDATGAYELTRHLLALGHQRITLVGSGEWRGPYDRIHGFRRALEEAGCDDPDVAAHCRAEKQHARGCWVVDLALGKR